MFVMFEALFDVAPACVLVLCRFMVCLPEHFGFALVVLTIAFSTRVFFFDEISPDAFTL